MRAVSVDYRVALLLIFAEVVLTRGPDIFYAGLVDDRAVVIVSYEDLVELLEYLCGQLLVVRLCQCSVDTLVDIEEVKSLGVESPLLETVKACTE